MNTTKLEWGPLSIPFVAKYNTRVAHNFRIPDDLPPIKEVTGTSCGCSSAKFSKDGKQFTVAINTGDKSPLVSGAVQKTVAVAFKHEDDIVRKVTITVNIRE